MSSCIITPEIVARWLGEKDITRVGHQMKLDLSLPMLLTVGGELVCEGIKITRINQTTFVFSVEILAEELEDILEGQELIRVPV